MDDGAVALELAVEEAAEELERGAGDVDVQGAGGGAGCGVGEVGEGGLAELEAVADQGEGVGDVADDGVGTGDGEAPVLKLAFGYEGRD